MLLVLLLLLAGLFALTATVGTRQVGVAAVRSGGRSLPSTVVCGPLLVRGTVQPDPEVGLLQDVWYLWLPGVPIELARGELYCGGYALF